MLLSVDALDDSPLPVDDFIPVEEEDDSSSDGTLFRVDDISRGPVEDDVKPLDDDSTAAVDDASSAELDDSSPLTALDDSAACGAVDDDSSIVDD